MIFRPNRPSFSGMESNDYAQFGVHRIVKRIKGASGRLLRKKYPHLTTRLPTLWTNSYFVSTVGGATLKTVKQYIENQKNV